MMMIFQKAERVVVWLGEASDDSALAMLHLSELSTEWDLDHDKAIPARMFRLFAAVFPRAVFFLTSFVVVARSRPFITTWAVAFYTCRRFWGPVSSGYTSMALKILTFWTNFELVYSLFPTYRLITRTFQDQRRVPNAVMAKALKGIFTRSWFRRVWIVQEIAVARDAIVVCGPDSMPWREFRKGCDQIERRVRRTSIRNPYIDTHFRQCTSIGKSLDISNLSSRKAQLKRKLLFLLNRFGHFDTTDPRDKIYGLLGLASEVQQPNAENEKIVPDYNQPTSMVYADLVNFLVSKTRRLDVLRACEGSRKIPDLPSWVPDWTCTAARHMERFQLEPYDLSSHPSSEIPVARFSNNLMTMTVRGFVMGHLVDSGEVLIRSHNSPEESLAKNYPITILNLIMKYGPWLINSGIFGFCMDSALWLFIKFVPEAKATMTPYYGLVNSLVEKFRSQLADEDWAGEDLSNGDEPGLPINWENIFEVQSSFGREESVIRIVKWKSVLKNTTIDPVKCRAYAADPQGGDLVCMFIGADEPCLVREEDDGYRLVGSVTFGHCNRLLWKDCEREHEAGTLILQDFELR
jgi:Heterokaryon incompatibility protein (HET)